MALIIEDGSIVAGANSFVTDVELTDYADQRALTLPATAAEREPLLIKAMDWLKSKEGSMQGYRVSRDQLLPFPRQNVYVNGWLLASDEIPDEAKFAQIEAAIAAQDMDLNTNYEVSNVQKEKVDVLEVSYFKGGNKTYKSVGRANTYLNPLLQRSGSSSTDILERT